jgi:hypothetical protein
MSIENLKTYLLSNAWHLQFMIAVMALLRKSGQNILGKIGTQYEILRACIEKEDRCFKVIRKSNYSALKDDKDHSRNTLIIGFKDAVKSALRHFDADVREAAQRIKIVFDTYNRPTLLTNLPYDAATIAVSNMLQEFEGKYAADIQTTKLAEWIIELRACNNAFDALAVAYNEEQAEKPPFNAKEVRKETDRAFQDMITIISALILMDSEREYVTFLTELNALIKHYNDLLAQHLGRIHARKEKEEEENKE